METEVIEQCANCRFARDFPEPGPKPVVPEPPKEKWWEIFTGPALPLMPLNFDKVALMLWQSAHAKREWSVNCRRFPKALQVAKTAWCGEWRNFNATGGE